jgi:hypothetical protein
MPSIRETPAGSIHEAFCMDDAHWNGWRSWLQAWIDSPMLSVRPEIHDWVSKKPLTGASSWDRTHDRLVTGAHSRAAVAVART